MTTGGDSEHSGRPLTRTDIVSTSEVAELLGIPRSTVHELARRGDLPARRVGRRWLFLLSRAIENPRWWPDNSPPRLRRLISVVLAPRGRRGDELVGRGGAAIAWRAVRFGGRASGSGRVEAFCGPGSWCRDVSVGRFRPVTGGCDECAGFAHAEGFAGEADDVAVVQKAVEDRGRDGLVGEEAGPAFELDVGGDDQAAFLVGG